MKYAIRIKEPIGKTVIVKADSSEEAIENIKNAYNDSNAALDNVKKFIEKDIRSANCFIP